MLRPVSGIPILFVKAFLGVPNHLFKAFLGVLILFKNLSCDAHCETQDDWCLIAQSNLPILRKSDHIPHTKRGGASGT